jgi:ubiquitin-like protein Pup
MAQRSRTKERAEEARAAETSHAPERAGRGRAAQVARDADWLLEEIDGILESNAAEFLASYVQHGGE